LAGEGRRLGHGWPAGGGRRWSPWRRDGESEGQRCDGEPEEEKGQRRDDELRLGETVAHSSVTGPFHLLFLLLFLLVELLVYLI
jgi:hypothetical protein